MRAAQICKIFDRCFARFHTTLVGGASEPLYEPNPNKARIYFREDYASSALHEAAHWCIAGADRRQKLDYGYWYVGERGLGDQRNFEAVEVKPQGLEWIFSVAAGVNFRVSCDNFDQTMVDERAFSARVQFEAFSWLSGLPPRAEQFVRSLIEQTDNQHALLLQTYKEPPK